MLYNFSHIPRNLFIFKNICLFNDTASNFSYWHQVTERHELERCGKTHLRHNLDTSTSLNRLRKLQKVLSHESHCLVHNLNLSQHECKLEVLMLVRICSVELH
jgi:hypothetical protein